MCAEVRFLGSYARHRMTRDAPVKAPTGLSDGDFADSAAWLTRLRTGEIV
jgi:prephenate dehydratase